ncbi:hypothetical protein HDU76_001235 [Blyttiomyces sp. JEL0837]|nr:hypothetical protein HDU76_001235 [Blyttiomyces sp. JEL0837]
MRHGYLSNTGIDTAWIRGKTFQPVFNTDLNSNISNAGQIYATPLTYTPPGHSQIVFVVTMENNVFTLDGQTGSILASRQIAPPFPVTKIIVGCTDITQHVGILSTPVIDPTTSTAYFVAKTYDGSPANYEVHAVDVLTLSEKSGFPVKLQGLTADNANDKIAFNSTTQMNRPALLLQDGTVYAAFASHCDMNNYSGWVFGIDATTGTVAGRFSTNFDPSGAPHSQTGGGIWMSGSGLASDTINKRIFLVTGNSFLPRPKTPVAGTNLDPNKPVGGNAVASIKFGVAGKGRLALQTESFFVPKDSDAMDAKDLDLGSSGVVLAMHEGGEFSGANTGGVERIAITGGKDGSLFVLNADNLGGYQQGPAKADSVICRINVGGGLYGRPAVSPLNGGWIFVNPVGSSLTGYRLGTLKGALTLVQSASAISKINAFGIGSPTITSASPDDKNSIIWYLDYASHSLLAYNGLPKGKKLELLQSWQLPSAINKFTNPGFGNQMVFVATADGHVIGYAKSGNASPSSSNSLTPTPTPTQSKRNSRGILPTWTKKEPHHNH